jgi:hypothetical protein
MFWSRSPPLKPPSPSPNIHLVTPGGSSSSSFTIARVGFRFGALGSAVYAKTTELMSNGYQLLYVNNSKVYDLVTYFGQSRTAKGLLIVYDFSLSA